MTALSFTTTGPAPGLWVAADTGIISGSPATAARGTAATVTLRASDPSGAQATTTFLLTVSAYGRSSLSGSLALTEVFYAQSDVFLVIDEFIEVTDVSAATNLARRDAPSGLRSG